MIGLDSNLLIRFIVRDDIAQADIAYSYIKRHSDEDIPLFINNIVLCEMVWVLKHTYEYSKEQIAGTIEKILNIGAFVFEDSDSVWRSLYLYKKNNLDFADALIGVSNKFFGCNKTGTLDKKAGKLTEFELIG